MTDFERAFRLENFGEEEKVGEDIFRYDAEYLGGHKVYTNVSFCELYLYPKEMVIKELDLHILYSSIKEISNIAQFRGRENVLSVVYNDGLQDQNLLFRIKAIEKARKRLYQKVMDLKKSQEAHRSSTSSVTLTSREKEIIKEKEVIVKVRCSYCHHLYDETLDKCPHCGGVA